MKTSTPSQIHRLYNTEDDGLPEAESIIDYYEEVGNISLFGPICIHVVAPLKKFLERFGEAHKNKKFRKKSGINHLTITINSSGGSAEQGLALYDLIKSSRFPVNTVALGLVASAAMMPFLAGRKKYIYPNAFLMTHHSSHWSDESQEPREADWYYRRGRELNLFGRVYNEIILANSSLSQTALRRLQKKEKLITAEEALKYGLAHEIIKNL